MSDLDRENLKDERQPLTKKSVNQSDTEDKGAPTDQAAAKAKKKKILWGALIILLVIGVILAIVLPLTLKGNGGGGDTPAVDPFNTQEFNGFSVDTTTYKSTVWNAEFQIKQQKAPTTQTPTNAFMKLQDTINGDSYKPANPQKVYNGTSNMWADVAQFNIDLVDNYQARVFIMNKNSTQYDIDRRTVKEDIFKRPVQAFEARLSQLAFKVSNESFGFSFGNIYTGETIISTKNRKLLVSDLYSEIGFVLPSQRCYGLGQRNGQFKLTKGMYTLHNKGSDQAIPVDERLGDTNGNHIHPFILCQTLDTKDFFGVFFVSTAPQMFEVIQYGGHDQMILNYVTIGAPLEMYFIMRGKANEIVQKYHAMVGNAQMPPYYALGHFQGSNAYSTWGQVSTVFTKYADSNVALEGVFIDNYNSQPHYTYTVDDTRFPNISGHVEDLHAASKRVIFGTSYALHNNKTDNYWYNVSIKHSALINSSNFMYMGEQTTGVLDQTTVNYLDAFTTGMQAFHQEALPAFNTTVGVFDGITVQDHFLPNQISGEVNLTSSKAEQEVTSMTRRRLDATNEDQVGSYEPYGYNNNNQGSLPSTYDLPFLPSFKTSVHLDNKTISLNSTHSYGNDKIAELYVHNGNAHLQLKKTWNAWLATNDSTTKRPLLFTEASWAGSGAFSVGLVTNLYRNWDSLRYLIDHALGLSISGMSNLMIDACQSLGPLDEELCGRTMQVAGFLPMVRNYYNATYKDPATGNRSDSDASESYNFQNVSFAAAYSDGVSNKLRFSRYTYSQMYQVYREGGALLRPMFFDYPNDDQCFNDAQTFMLGDSIKVSPVLEQNKADGTTYKSYFPAGLWIDTNDWTTLLNLTTGDYQTLNASYSRTNAYLKGGKIVPYILNSDQKKTLTEIQKTQKTGFKVLRDSANAYAEGFVLIDDGESYRSYIDEQYTYWKLRYAEKSINFWVQYGNFNYEPTGLNIHKLDYIDIVNAEDLASTNFACYLGVNLNPVNLNHAYNNDTKTLRISPVDNADVAFNTIGFIKFGDSNVEPNFCDKTLAFTYSGAQNTTISNKTYLVYNISSNSKSSALENLIVEFALLDDAGTINVQITTQSDFESLKTIKYHVPTPDVYDLSAWWAINATKDISDFVKVYTETGFYYEIYKAGGTDLLWKSDVNHLYMDDYFIMDSGIFTANTANGKPLLGMGERAGSVFYKNENGGIHSRYTFDQANPIDDGAPPGRNFYGYQPFYSYQAQTSDWVGVFDISSYATDYILYSDIGSSQTQIHKIAIGGSINKFFFVGAKIDDVIKKYQTLVGKPTVPPLWAFGWQQSRFGYVTSADWWAVYQNYTTVFDLPLDVMWADIDYMDDYKLFTISPQSYADLPEKVKQIKADGRYFVPIMDAGVAVRENQGYKALDDGINQDVFIKQSNKKDYLTAGVWCGNAYFPDFFKDSAVTWWKASFEYLYKETTEGGLGLQFDGVWLDENEATNFCNGYCKPEERPADSLRNKPFYVPGWRDLEDKALGVDGYHDQIKRHEYDVHNLYSLMQSKATADFLRNKLAASGNARPYVLSRSNYPGIGKHAHHWMGDNWSTVDYMAVSVDGVMSYNLFGLPFMGSDICGFNGDAAPDLCTKWHQLGSLYPFARNHNQNASASQEPYRFNTTIPGSSETTYTDVIKTALINRYSLIHYYYSSFHSIYEFGGSFFKPLFYEFQNDVKTFDETMIKNNILLGEGLKASIQTQTLNFTTNSTSEFYFPADKWCQVLPYPDASKCWDTTTDPATQTLNSGLEDYYVHIRGGHIIPWQNATVIKARKTLDLVNHTIDFLVLPENTKATMTLPSGAQYMANAVGFIYYDDGITYDEITRFELYLANNGDNTATLKIVNANKVTTKRNTKHEDLGVLYIMGAIKSGFNTLNKATIGGKSIIDPVYDAISDTLTVNMTDATGTVYNIYDVTDVQLTSA